MKFSSIIVAGFDNFVRRSEIITGKSKQNQSLNLPESNGFGRLVMHNGSILLCGGIKDKNCLKLTQGTWKHHSTLNQNRSSGSIVSTNTATFIFGGNFESGQTFEYLPNNSTTWILGKTEIPLKHAHGCAIFVESKQEVWLIGGYNYYTQFSYRDLNRMIFCFNVNDHTFRPLHISLFDGRESPSCAIIPGTNQIMITGGKGKKNNQIYNSTELLDIDEGSIRLARPLNSKRYNHGIGIITVDGEDKLAVFGGRNFTTGFLQSVEIYDKETECWNKSKIKLESKKGVASSLSVKLGVLYEMFTSKSN